jgi:hypothetical protein
MSDFHQMTITSAQHTHTVKMCEIMNERVCPKGSEGNGQAVLYAYAKSHLEGQGGGEISIDEIATFINDEYGFYEPPISYDEGKFVVNDSPRVFSDSEIATMKIPRLKAELIKWTALRTHVGKKAVLVAKLRSICAGKTAGQQRRSIHPYEMGETIRKKRISLIGARLKSNVAKYPPLWINSVAPTPVATPVLSPSLQPGINSFKKRPADTLNRRSPSSGLRHSGVCDNPMNRQCVRCCLWSSRATAYQGKNFHCHRCLPR